MAERPSGVRQLMAVACTIGSNLENRATALFDEGRPLAGLILDAIGTVAINNQGKEVTKYIDSWASCRGLNIVPTYRPRYCGDCWDAQKSLLSLLPRNPGITLTELGVMIPMIPRKSVSMFVGLGETLKRPGLREECLSCAMSEGCQHRDSPSYSTRS